jgi:lipopolysaccharide transport protein LptA
MTAESINLNFTEDGQTLRSATLSGKASIQLAAGSGKAGRRIAADWLELGFAPDGSTVTQVSGRDQVALEFPPEGDTPGRSVHAARLEAIGEAGKGLVSAKLAGNVEYREQQKASGPTPALNREVKAGTLEMGLAPGMAGINDATFTGDQTVGADNPARLVRMTDGGLEARAPEIRYRPAGQTIVLIAPADDPAASTTVTDRDVLIKARQITVALDGRKMQADGGDGEVRTELRPSTDAAQGKTPGMLKADSTVLTSSKQLAYDGAAGTAEYTGGANIFQGATAIRADTILLDRSKGNLTAKGKVRSNMMFEDSTSQEKAEGQTAAIARAGELTYDDETRRLTYVGDAFVSGPQGEVKAARVELFLGKTESALERVEAYEAVSVGLPTRLAKGTRLTYVGADGRYEMLGDPASVVQAADQDCRETTSQTLTFSRSGAGISAGDARTRQQTKDKVACPPGIKPQSK